MLVGRRPFFGKGKGVKREKNSEFDMMNKEEAKEKIYIGHVSTIILGEITKKLLKFKKEANYRYKDIVEDIFSKLLSFRILYICEETIKNHSNLNIRGDEKSQDKLNLSCAIQNRCNLFIMNDSGFTYNKKGCLTSIAQLTDRKNEKLKKLLNQIKLGQSSHS